MSIVERLAILEVEAAEEEATRLAEEAEEEARLASIVPVLGAA